MRIIQLCTTVFITLFCFTQSWSQDNAAIREKINKDLIKKETGMITYVIEREIPEAGKLTQEQLKGISKKSNEVLSEMGPGIEWLHSYITENKVYCLYKAENKKAIEEHARKGGFPANKISELSTTIDPDTVKD